MGLTMKDIADRVGVHRTAVSRVLNGKADAVGLSDDTIRRIERTARELGFRPNAAARAMAVQRTWHIGVVVHSLAMDRTGDFGGHAYDTVSGISSVLEPAGYTTCLVQMMDVERGEAGMARLFREQALDGMIVHAAVQQAARAQLDSISDRIIWCDAGCHESTDCIWRDEHAAGYLAGQAVREAGYDELLFIASGKHQPRPYHHRPQREAGLREAFDEVGGTVHVLNLQPEPDEAAAQLADYLKPGLAVVVCEYKHAERVALMGASFGLSPGQDFALASCDDRGWYDQRWPHLARAQFDRFAMGRHAAEMMLERLEGSGRRLESYIEKPAWIAGTALAPTVHPTLVRPEQLRRGE
jgi:DNA-binding LacI/PurR family transcriptional regulator